MNPATRAGMDSANSAKAAGVAAVEHGSGVVHGRAASAGAGGDYVGPPGPQSDPCPSPTADEDTPAPLLHPSP